MTGIYFSGTGNSKYAVELFCKEYENESLTYSIEDAETLTAIRLILINVSDADYVKSCAR